MISLEKVQLLFGGFELFKNVSFLITPRDRIGLIGKNGAGKTTLLKIIKGDLQSTSGNVTAPKDITIGYLPQHMQLQDIRTLRGETLLAFDELIGLETKIADVNDKLATREDYESNSYLQLLNQIDELNERYQILGGGNYEAEMEQTLIGLGFKRSDLNRLTSEFSGGWRMRIELAKLLLRKPDIFLLDEPTNHLDIESIQWLEDFLRNYAGAVMLVSHDKAFLNAVCNRTIEISLGKAIDQKMNYSNFVDWKKEQREIQLAAYKNQQKMIQETEAFIERFRYKATKAVQVQSRINQLARLERIELDEVDTASLKINFPPPPRSGKIVVEGKSVSKSYGNLQVLNDIDLIIERGDKIAFVGKNGEGKTTLVRIIMQELEHQGHLKVGHNVKIGYFAQNQADRLDVEKTVLTTIDDIAVGDVRTKIRDILGAFLFSGEAVDKKVKVLSGGEKSRLAMIKLLLEPVNLLVLDEPTNHLDIHSKEILKEALRNFEGTVIVVSHDRDFLDGLVTNVYEFRNKKIKNHLGGIFDFLEHKKMENLKELEIKNKTEKTTKKKQKNSDSDAISYEERKEINRAITRLEKQVQQEEVKIEDLENRLEKINTQLSSAEMVVEDNAIFDEYNQLKKELELAMTAWEEQHNKLEEYLKKKTW